MTILVNNKPVNFPSRENITSVLKYLHIDNSKGVAVAINNQVVAKSLWERHIVNENDHVTIIRATQGG